MGKRRVLIAGVAVVLAGTAVSGVAIARGSNERLRAELAGTNEVPLAADPDSRGRVKVDLHIEDDEVCFSLRFDATGAPNRGHIHVGAAGVNGGIVVTLFELASPPLPAPVPADARHDELEEGRLEDCVPADPAVLQAIAANPGGYYVNLHNTRFPAGATRGQLE